MDDKTIGFIGVGRMGRHMSARMMAAGHRLVVYDTDARALQAATAHGALVAHSAADAASQAEIVFASLPTPDIVRAGRARGRRRHRADPRSKRSSTCRPPAPRSRPKWRRLWANAASWRSTPR